MPPAAKGAALGSRKGFTLDPFPRSFHDRGAGLLICNILSKKLGGRPMVAPTENTQVRHAVVSPASPRGEAVTEGD